MKQSAPTDAGYANRQRGKRISRPPTHTQQAKPPTKIRIKTLEGMRTRSQFFRISTNMAYVLE
eukprot:4541517-Pleurochrysis_carterae.AAC.2